MVARHPVRDPGELDLALGPDQAPATNSPSLAIARSLGFAGYGQNLIARLPA